MQWVSRITTVALMTVLPIWGGGWLDRRFATEYWGWIGLVFGLALGFWQLMLLVKSAGAKSATARMPGRSKQGSSGVAKPPPSSTTVSASTAEIAKQIDAMLEQEKRSPEREP